MHILKQIGQFLLCSSYVHLRKHLNYPLLISDKQDY